MATLSSNVVPLTGGAPYDIPYSVKFSGDQWLIKTDGAGNRQKFTASFWFKRTRLGNLEEFWNCTDNTTGDFLFRFNNDNLNLYDQAGGFTTNANFRDTTAWMHCVLRIDTTQSTSSDRLRLYINGEQVTSFSAFTTPSQNASFNVGRSGYRHIFGAYWTSYPNGIRGLTHLMLSEFHLVDGQSLGPEEFGKENKYGGWEAIEYTGSHGTNGYYHKFDNSSNLGDVEVGSNFGTVHSLSARYQYEDSPSKNLPVWNYLENRGMSYTAGNIRAEANGSWSDAMATIRFPSSGKFYAEFLPQIDANQALIGISSFATTEYAWYSGSGNINGGFGFSYTTNDIIGMAVDIDGGTIKVYKNNSLQGTKTGASDLHTMVWYSHGYDCRWFANFGQDSSFDGRKTEQNNQDGNGIGDFYYTPPSGYLTLCKAHMPDPDVIPHDYFKTILYTGNSSSRTISGVGFQPDFNWTKPRNAAGAHVLVDSARGNTKFLELDQDGPAEYTTSSGITGWNSDGYTLGTGNDWNISNETFVSWNWKCNGGTSSSNTNGSITSTVQVNSDAGFSMVKYVGTGSSATVGHGLSQAPDVVVTKNRTNDRWTMWHIGLNGRNGDHWLDFSLTNGVFVGFGNRILNVGSTTFGVDNQNETNGTQSLGIIAWCWHAVEGFSNFGYYNGNGSTNGPFVNCGFRPAFVIIKRTDSNGYNWHAYDNTRSSEGNPMDNVLFPNMNGQEENGNDLVDTTATGFKIRTADRSTNTSGAKYVYLAFADTADKYGYIGP